MQDFRIISRGELAWLECASFAHLPWLLHAFSTRRGGVSAAPAAGLNLGFTEGDRRAHVEANRRMFLQQLGAQRFSLAALRQVHSADVYRVVREATENIAFHPLSNSSPREAGDPRSAGDALVTDQAGILLSVRSADCLPVLLVDAPHGAIGAIHAGWRGALEGILEITVGEMGRRFSSHPRDLLAALGPSIRACCYEVGEEVVAAFCDRFPNGKKFFRRVAAVTAAPTGQSSPLLSFVANPLAGNRSADSSASASNLRACLDLVAVAREQLRNAGVPASRLYVAEFCTACRTDLFFSHRKEGPGTGRLMAVIGIRPG